MGERTMKIKLVLSSICIVILLLTIPHSAALPYHSAVSHSNTSFMSIKDMPVSDVPLWFTTLYTIIIYSLKGRIVLVTPLAITPGEEYWGDYDIISYAFFFLLLTLVYRFAFWHTFLHKIAENHNWDISNILVS